MRDGKMEMIKSAIDSYGKIMAVFAESLGNLYRLGGGGSPSRGDENF